MRPVLRAIQSNPRLQLQIIITGMHLDRGHGHTIEQIQSDGWPIDARVDWKRSSRAAAVGKAIDALSKTFKKLRPDIVLIVGDRVEALAAATAAHLDDIAVAHIHGGDRALGQMDDSLRHAISKLAHLHFPATKTSARRLEKMGEDRWRIRRAGSPGIDGIKQIAASPAQVAREFPGSKQFALVVLHPMDADDSLEFRRAAMVSNAIEKAGFSRAVAIYPNNDPGSRGIIRKWESLSKDPRFTVRPNVPRDIFLGLLRDAVVLVGNSSSGIIEAASFRTPVIDIGGRQQGRERCGDVQSVPYQADAIARAIGQIWNNGRPRRGKCSNPYGGRNAGSTIAETLAKVGIDAKLLRKIISY